MLDNLNTLTVVFIVSAAEHGIVMVYDCHSCLCIVFLYWYGWKHWVISLSQSPSDLTTTIYLPDHRLLLRSWHGKTSKLTEYSFCISREHICMTLQVNGSSIIKSRSFTHLLTLAILQVYFHYLMLYIYILDDQSKAMVKA